MKESAVQTLGFLKTTAVGGLVFLLLLAVIGAILGYVYSLRVFTTSLQVWPSEVTKLAHQTAEV